ncbi:MAG: hypothetical protein VX346_11650 [Planctomycetota bacterium]|nr:hypothetical protein [Planctomycetota bacterium]
MTHRLSFVLTLTGLLFATSLSGTERAKDRWPPRLLLNSDCGTPVFYKFDAPMGEDQLCHVLNDLPGTLIDAFLPCPQFSDDQMWFPTRVAEVYDGRHVPDGQFEDPYFKRVANNVLSLNQRGIDPLEVWQRRAHQHGLLFLPSLRMNDIHKDYVDRWPSLRSNWEQARPQLLIGKAIPPWYSSPYKYTWAMDYTHTEVRQRKLDIITEICSRYGVDGFELDFLRHPYYFKHGHEAQGKPIMNHFIAAVRQKLDAIGKTKGQRLRLLVRVPPHLDECQQIGLDVPTWIRNDWVDMVIPMAPGYLDMNANVADFVELATGTDCVVAGGLEYYVRGYKEPDQQGITNASLEMLRAGAATIWAQGAASVYLFNYDCHGPFPFRGDKRQALQEIGDPAFLVNKNKRYLVSVDMDNRTRAEGGNKQLPALLTAKDKDCHLQFLVADNLAKSNADRTLESTELTISASDVAHLQVQLNDRVLEVSEQSGTQLRFVMPPVVQGNNRLDIRLRPAAPQTMSRVREVDFTVRYR